MRTVILALSAAYLLALGGCNTMAGAGEDIQRGGQKIENAAKKNN